jgi:L-2,4-diaminobutyrate transaminase
MSYRTNELTAWDRDHFFHPSTSMGAHARGEAPSRIIASGEGVYITDTSGRRSLDAFGGLYCVNVGYGRREIADAISDQARKLAYYHAYAGHGSEASIRLAKMIIDRAPNGMSRVFFGLSGSDANETIIKLVWYYNNALGRAEKKKIISRWRGYHGSGIMTGSLTGLELFHNAFDLPRAPILHTEAPYYFRRSDRSLSEEQFSEFARPAWRRRSSRRVPRRSPPSLASRFWGPAGSCRLRRPIGIKFRWCCVSTRFFSSPMR